MKTATKKFTDENISNCGVVKIGCQLGNGGLNPSPSIVVYLEKGLLNKPVFPKEYNGFPVIVEECLLKFFRSQEKIK